jgi:hypothetical protein
MSRLARLARALDVAAAVITATAEVAVAAAGAIQTVSSVALVADHQVDRLRTRIAASKAVAR